MAKKVDSKKDKKKDEPQEKTVCRNRRALHQYDILDTIEAGLVLTGTEVKSLRNNTASLEDAYARIENDELWLVKSEIPEYLMGNRMNHEPKRKRKLLIHRRELEKFAKGTEERGFTLVPLKLYFRGGRAKVEIALAKGKKLYDKRESIKNRESKRELGRAMRQRTKS